MARRTSKQKNAARGISVALAHIVPLNESGTGDVTFHPTPEDREFVKRSCAIGLTQKQLATGIINPITGKPISVDTLKKNFEDEIARGRILTNDKIMQTLYSHAFHGEEKTSLTAAIFLAKTVVGLRETSRVETTGANGGAIQVDDVSMSVGDKAAKIAALLHRASLRQRAAGATDAGDVTDV